MYAAKLWEEFGNVDKAEVIAQTAEHLREHLEGRAHLGDAEGEVHKEQGREDREALNIRERAPKLGQQVEILMYAAKLWKEFGNVD